MAFRIRLAVLTALSLPIGLHVEGALAQQNTADMSVLLKKLDEQEKRIEALEKELRAQKEEIAQAAQRQEAERNATPTPSSTATAGATAAVSGKAAIEASSNAGPVGSSQGAAGTVVAGPSGLFISSADGANVIRFRGNLAVDGRFYSDKSTPDTAETWTFRRVRPYFEGTLDRIYDFRFMPDFGNGKSIIVDAFVTGDRKSVV